MLPIEDSESDTTKSQWYKYQVMVWTKLTRQLYLAHKFKQPDRYTKIAMMITTYGMILEKEYDFELERKLDMLNLFEKMRDV